MNRTVAPRLDMIRAGSAKLESSLIAGCIDRPINSWMEFSIDTQNLSILKHRRSVVQAIAGGNLGEPDDGSFALT